MAQTSCLKTGLGSRLETFMLHSSIAHRGLVTTPARARRTPFSATQYPAITAARSNSSHSSSNSVVAPASLRQLVGDLRSGALSPSVLMQTTIDRIQEMQRLNAFVCLEDAEVLMKMAAGSDPSSPLAGLPVAIKDNLCTAGMTTSAASRTLQGYVPTYDADVVARIKAAGGIVVGKTNMDEFGMGSSTESSLYVLKKGTRMLR